MVINGKYGVRVGVPTNSNPVIFPLLVHLQSHRGPYPCAGACMNNLLVYFIFLFIFIIIFIY